MKKSSILLNNLFSKRNRALLKELVVTEFKLRYQGSMLGYAWSLLKPLGLFTILYLVFVKFLQIGNEIPNFPVYLLLGIVLWTFFLEATTGALTSIVARGDVIRKIKFPKYIIVISGTVSALINLAFNMVVVLVFCLISSVEFSHRALSAPLFIFELYILTIGIGFLLSAAYVKFRDISHIWDVLMQGAFYATPILYPIAQVEKINQTAAKVIMLSPVAQIIQDLRFSLISDQTRRTVDIVQYPWSLIPYVLVLVIFILGTVYFRANSKYFAEKV